MMSLFISSHYKNSPNDLQLLSDAPAHLVFVLLGPLNISGIIINVLVNNLDSEKTKIKVPDILCAIQLGLEGEISNY